MISGGEALTYNAAHVLYNLLSNPECMSRLGTDFSMLKSGYGDNWRDPGLGELPYLVCCLL